MRFFFTSHVLILFSCEKVIVDCFLRGIFGEPTGARTLDLLIKSQLLYQLSYRLSPNSGAVERFVCCAAALVACVYADIGDIARGKFHFFNSMADNWQVSAFDLI